MSLTHFRTLGTVLLPALTLFAVPVVCASAPGSPGQTRREAATPKTADAQAQASETASPDVAIKDVLWGKAADGLQPGFLLSGTGPAQIARVPLNSPVEYVVLVRNTTTEERSFEVRLGGLDPWNMAPSVVPSEHIEQALRSRSVLERYRALALADLSDWPASYFVKLAPGESVVVPGKTGLYIGEADKGRYPRLETVTAGSHWLVQPVTVRILTAAEKTEFAAMLATPYSTKRTVTVFGRDGKSRAAPMAQIGAQGGGKQLYARLQIEIENRDTR